MIDWTITDWKRYKYGFWRRIGDSLEVRIIHDRPILPVGLLPDYDYYAMGREPLIFCIDLPSYSKPYWHVWVKIKGWENKVVECDGIIGRVGE